LDPYSPESVKKLLKKYKDNINIIKGNSNEILPAMTSEKFDYVFLDGGHKYETVLKDLKFLTQIIKNNGVILCDDYDLTYAPGVKKAIDEYVLLNNFNLKILYSRFAEITKSAY
jgi:predicted O-methyltransferase YrrM